MWTVANLSDNGTGSLRQAVSDAFSGDSIVFASGLTGTVSLLSGEILLDKDLIIAGPGATNLAISGSNSNRLFEIATNATVNISGLAIRDGHALDGANGTNAPASPGGNGTDGGAIYNRGTLSMNDCEISDNASGSGGDGGNSNNDAMAVESGGRTPLFKLTANDQSNSLDVVYVDTGEDGGNGGNGGGIYNEGFLTLSNCTLTGNSTGHGGNGGQGGGFGGAGGAAGSGGAIYNAGTATLMSCAFVGNLSGNGGDGGSGLDIAGIPGAGGDGAGLCSSGSLAIGSCTFMANHSGMGGAGGSKSSGASDGARGGDGAGIFNVGEMSVELSTFTGNSAGDGGAAGPGHDTGLSGGSGGQGGGIWNAGAAEVLTSSFSQNTGGGGGDGGVAIEGGPGGTGGDGGGIHNEGVLTLEFSTLNANLAGNGGVPNNGGAGGDGGNGGGICSTGELTIAECTLSGNSSGAGADASLTGDGLGNGGNGGNGGGVYNAGTITVIASTIAENASGAGGAMGNASPGADGSGGGVFNAAASEAFQSVNVIFALNTVAAGGSGPDVDGNVDSLGHNLVGIVDGSSGFVAAGDQSGTSATPLDPLLGPLEDNGGPTFSRALRQTSPAIGAGDDRVITNYDLLTDQRGGPRQQGAHVDIGAVEVSLPEVQTETAAALDLSTVELNGAVNPNGFPTASFFEWGTTTNYGNSTMITNAGSDNTVLTIAETLTGLVEGVLYHFRAAASNSVGEAFGDDLQFTTTDSDGDGIPDSWMEQYFGHATGSSADNSRPQDDADGTGQNNLFKYVAGLDPTNSASRFVLNILDVTNQEAEQNLTFAPETDGRTYSVEFSTDLTTDVWNSVTNTAGPVTNGDEISVIDLDASQSQKFYRVRISRP